ncbi:MAG: ATP-dependent Clp protease proteolytic subunit [Verrucomicrobiota bacterium]|jgi:membrane-bound serine protease (ClpP class)|nr:ATP-dependent Clp protease proteolytic subunit [Verrucomicrobiota bacterium]
MKTFAYLLCILAFLLPPAWSQEGAAAPEEAPVYILPIRGQIEGAMLYVLRRGLAEADQKQAAAVLLVMDTPGGTLATATDIVRAIQASRVPVYTFVENQALSAGAIIALSTKKIFMAPGTVIGDALPILMSPWGGIQEMSPSVEEKAVSSVAALIRAAAQAAGHDPDLGEKMVRRELDYAVDGKVISPAGQLLTLTADEAAQRRADGTPVLSAGTAATVETVLDRLNLAQAPRHEMEVRTAEKVARWIAAAAPILMMLGFLGIYIEFKMPGIGLPGILGALCLALFFWGHHIAGLAGMEDLLLLGAGVALVALDMFIIPGFGIMAVLGILLILLSLIGSMTHPLPGLPLALPGWAEVQTALTKTMLAIAGTGLAAGVLSRFLPKSRLFRRLTLTSATRADEGYTASQDFSGWLGQTGVALTPLHPSGVIRIGDQRLDVITEGEFLDAGTAVRVAVANGNHVVVQKAE